MIRVTQVDTDQIVVEDRPYPKIQKPTDAILKVTSTALCVGPRFALTSG